MPRRIRRRAPEEISRGPREEDIDCVGVLKSNLYFGVAVVVFLDPEEDCRRESLSEYVIGIVCCIRIAAALGVSVIMHH